VERGSEKTKPIEAAVHDLMALLREDAEALDCRPEIEHATQIVRRGSSASGQVHAYAQARLAGQSKVQAARTVVDWLLRLTADPNGTGDAG
jgi:glutamate---cysteine ligase / carboxylate-amine ligase